jgi:hypothetical protein
MRSSVLSRRTTAVAVLGTAAVAVVFLLVQLGVGGEAGTLWASDLGEALIVGASAAVVLWVALSLSPGEPLRRQWLPIGLGMLSFAIGDLVWTYLEAFRGLEVPFPGPPDVFYMLEYPLLAVGLMSAGLAYRGLVDLRRPALLSAAAGSVAVVLLVVGFLGPFVFASDASVAEKAVSAFYPLADIAFGIGPAIFLVLVVAQLGGGRLGWPWWAVGAGVLFIAVSDCAYALLSAADLYGSGSLIDYGWSVGHLLIAVGASIAWDVAHPNRLLVAAAEPIPG